MKFTVVIPLHKANLSNNEIKNIKISKHNNPCVDFFFIIPKSYKKKSFLKTTFNFKIKLLDDIHFKSIESYNKLMLSQNFYKSFSKYDYLIICQTDGFLINDIFKFQKEILKYDYIGAPWKKPFYENYFSVHNIKILKTLTFLFNFKKLQVGNGGVSIRRIAKFIEVLEKHTRISRSALPEDITISYLGSKNIINIPNLDTAKKFFSETILSNSTKILGYHGMEIYNKKLQKKIYSIFKNKI
tara:strand:- start:236 stop:961 length:726 start_codon:yes stop_codon:yes gene_type:complete